MLWLAGVPSQVAIRWVHLPAAGRWQALNLLWTWLLMGSSAELQLQKITCHMYMPSTQTTEVNRPLFCARRGEVEWSQLPPCKDCLFLHAVRANYQAVTWRRHLQSQPFVSSPRTWLDYRWRWEVDNWVDAWLTRTICCAAVALPQMSTFMQTFRLYLHHMWGAQICVNYRTAPTKPLKKNMT